MGRWLASIGIVLLIVLDVALPATELGYRNPQTDVRRDAPDAVGEVGGTLPDLAWQDLEGRPVRLGDFRGSRVVLTFERSVDW